MKRYQIIYTDFTEGKGHLRTGYKATIPSAANLLHRVFQSLNLNVMAFFISDGETWIEYDFPWMPTRKEVVARLEELEGFHEAFYDSHQN